ncbi:hypothetical protein Taro_034584 [Colocasia esculenta]|uniref:Uncharacterized protein n=1 Tax=Colocasia esculenta TaxID=4460 RepID=A0A843WAH4_COLES|nr:hypothetical protein [Colocasia esculenta]
MYPFLLLLLCQLLLFQPPLLSLLLNQNNPQQQHLNLLHLQLLPPPLLNSFLLLIPLHLIQRINHLPLRRFKLGLPDVSRGQWENLLRGQREITPSMTVAIPSGLYPSLVGAISARKDFAQSIFNRHIRIATRFKIKYKLKLCLQRFMLMQISKNPLHILDFQLCFAESERISLDQWAAVYPVDHADCEKLKLSPYAYLSKGYKDLRKIIGPKWELRYLVYYQAKEAAMSQGLHWNTIVHDFLHLAASLKFVSLKQLLRRTHFYQKLSWYHKRHIKSHRKLPSISPSYNIDMSLFENFFPEKEKKLWDLIQPYLNQIPRSLKFVLAFPLLCKEDLVEGAYPEDLQSTTLNSLGYKSSQCSLSLLRTTHGATTASATRLTPSSRDDEPLAEGSRGVSLANKAQ